jgi:hypothetical protein
MHDLISEARALFHRAPSRRAWRDLCALLDHADLTGADGQALLDYCDGHLSRWPDTLREAPTRWAVAALDGRPRPQLRVARSARLSLAGADAAQVRAFFHGPDAANLRRLDALEHGLSEDVWSALKDSPLGARLTHLGHVFYGELGGEDAAIQGLLDAPHPNWSREGCLRVDGTLASTARALRGPGARAIRKITSPDVAGTCIAIARHDGPLNLRALSFYGGHPFSEEDARALDHATLPHLTSLNVHLGPSATAAQDDPLGVLANAGVLSRLTTLSLTGARRYDAIYLDAPGLRALSLTRPYHHVSGQLLSGANLSGVTSLELRSGSFRRGLVGATPSRLERLTVEDATLSIEDYQVLRDAPIAHLTLRGGHDLDSLSEVPPGLRALVEAPMPRLHTLELQNLGSDEVSFRDLVGTDWFPRLERLVLRGVSAHPDARLQAEGLLSALERAHAPSLSMLDLSNCGLDDRLVDAVAGLGAAPHRLDLSHNALRDPTPLLGADLSRLRELDLSYTPLDPARLNALLASGALPALGCLDLSHALRRPGGLAAALAGADLTRLHTLSLHGCAISLDDAVALTDAVLPTLEVLSLADAQFAPNALEHIVRAEAAAGLVSLRIPGRLPERHRLSARLGRSMG